MKDDLYDLSEYDFTRMGEVVNARVGNFDCGTVAFVSTPCGSSAFAAKVGIGNSSDYPSWESVEPIKSLKDYLYDDVTIEDDASYTLTYYKRSPEDKEWAKVAETITGKEINDGYSPSAPFYIEQLESGMIPTPFESFEIVAGKAESYKQVLKDDKPHYRDLEYGKKKKKRF